VKKKQDKIDGLFKEYFSGGSEKKLRVSDARVFRASVCACESMAFYDADRPLPVKEKCPDVEKLGAYIDDSLDKKEAGILEGHILGCKKCREKVREAKSAVEQFEKGALPEAPQTVSSEELSRLSKKKPNK
jgi:hypothetical protein